VSDTTGDAISCEADFIKMIELVKRMGNRRRKFLGVY
jgi:hypothetical protein